METFLNIIPIIVPTIVAVSYTHLQSELIAKKTAECLGIPYANCMIKTKHNSEQHRLHLKDRKENVKGVYELEENKPVSYTHLDVYKRQEHGSVNGLMRAKRKV